MGSWLLGCVLLCLPGTSAPESQVIQTPRHLIAKTGKSTTVTCSQNMNYDTMYWYRQDPGLGLKLIYYSINTDIIEKGEISDGYSISRKEKKIFPLTVDKANASQTSVYLCAISITTALRSQMLSVQKGQPQEGEYACL